MLSAVLIIQENTSDSTHTQFMKAFPFSFPSTQFLGNILLGKILSEQMSDKRRVVQCCMSQYQIQQFVSTKALFGINKGHVQLALAAIARVIELTVKIATYRWTYKWV